eukprot:scaffold33737_cov101-Isochrysis_galbana.AAC.1
MSDARTECPGCGRTFAKLGTHLSRSARCATIFNGGRPLPEPEMGPSTDIQVALFCECRKAKVADDLLLNRIGC